MYLACACSLLVCYVGWTICAARYAVENAAGNNANALICGKLVLFFIYLYSPCYNLGYNALTYSMYHGPCSCRVNVNISLSLLGRAISVRNTLAWYHHISSTHALLKKYSPAHGIC